MLTHDTRRAAALLLRWAAQLAAGEDPIALSGCRVPLRDLGYDLDALEPLVTDLAEQVLTYIAQVATRTTREERRAA